MFSQRQNGNVATTTHTTPQIPLCHVPLVLFLLLHLVFASGLRSRVLDCNTKTCLCSTYCPSGPRRTPRRDWARKTDGVEHTCERKYCLVLQVCYPAPTSPLLARATTHLSRVFSFLAAGCVHARLVVPSACFPDSHSPCLSAIRLPLGRSNPPSDAALRLPLGGVTGMREDCCCVWLFCIGITFFS